MNSFHRGARAERQWAKQLTEAGFPARRTCQHFGGPETPDVASSALGLFHYEVKNQERVNTFAAFAQAAQDAGAGKIPILAMRRNGTPFLVVMHSADFLMLLNAGALAELSGARKAEAAEKLQAPTPQHLALTKKAMQLEPHECLELIADVILRFPHLKKSVAALCEGATK